METVIKHNGNIQLTDNDIKLLVSSNIIPKDTPKDVIALFGKVCNEKQLSPFSKQIHLIPRRDGQSGQTKYTFQTSIDGYRTIAERTGQYAGNDDYKFNDDKTEYELIKDNIKQPTTATATVYKLVGGTRYPFIATARWEEYYPGDKIGFMWKKMPFLLLGKCSEALALRKAFPEALGGIYTDEEMHQSDKTQEAEIIEEKRNYTEEAEVCKTLEELNSWWKGLTLEERKQLEGLKNHCKEKFKKEDIVLNMIESLTEKNYKRDHKRIEELIDKAEMKKRVALSKTYINKLDVLKIPCEYQMLPI